MDARPEAASPPAPRTITYSLSLGARTSDDYYRTIARFTDDWTAKAVQAVGDVLSGFAAFRRERGQTDRTEAELAFEFLALGVLLYEHGWEAAHWPRWLARGVERLVALQRRWPASEGWVKAARGLVARLVRRPQPARLNADTQRLLEWLRANGETVRAERLADWEAYFDEIGRYPARRILVRCLALATTFSVDSALALGKYTAAVTQFLAVTAPRYHGRYDSELVSRSRLEYHLGLLGTETLNRAYRARFAEARRKIVIVPPCLRAQPEERCQARLTSFGARCQGCTPGCRVHQITRLGQKRGFEVYIIPDDLRTFDAAPAGESPGIVGVSCALTNWGGGWEMDALGVPAQGVLLDYVGCSFHWDEHGFPTDVNLRQLQQVVGLRERAAADARQ